jgi:GNAT superfamily N-acetyltransferase
MRRAMPADLLPLLALVNRYYTEWDIWQQDSEADVRKALEEPSQLGYWLAEIDGTATGCVLCKPLPGIDKAVECKRLFVTPEFRGHGLAAQLMDAAESAAAQSGAVWMYLDTKQEFAAAIALYRRRGYEDCPRYNDNAQATIFLRKRLIV